ncbi:MAG: Superkiller protein 3 [Vezdaea aestivalis]|nr:MAG: Superkiller protein 3 [Vezdaea aestivalis]
MATAKAALKAAKQAIDAHQYDQAIHNAKTALTKDPRSYHAYVFLGLANNKLGEQSKAVTAYDKATSIKGDDILAWQGLIAVYDTSNPPKVAEYQDAALRLAQIYELRNERAKCQQIIDKFLLFAKSGGSDGLYRRALEVILPSSPIYNYLEGLIPHPSLTWIKIAGLLEKEETGKINKQIGERRTRLGAKLGQVTSEVKREVYQASPLEGVYEEIINWTLDDVIRHQYEEQLLLRAYDTLIVLPTAGKRAKRDKVLKLAQDLVILKREVSLAWHIVFEWKDAESILSYDVSTWNEFIELFPGEGLALVFKGFLASDVSPFSSINPKASESAGDPNVDEAPSEENSAIESDPLVLMTDGLRDVSRSTLAHRLVAEYYLHTDEYEAATETARIATKLAKDESSLTGLNFVETLDAIGLLLGTALIYYQTPKNHVEAQDLFGAVLKRTPTSATALLGSGLILQQQGKYEQAAHYLKTATTRDPSDVKIRAEYAWCSGLGGSYEIALQELQDCLPMLQLHSSKSRELKSVILYRIGMCIWELKQDRKQRKDRKGPYSYFLDSLKANLNYAPAYTMLGVWYSDYANDEKRARKCFQKAFEISTAETESAHRLAESFADSGEWDLVEAVARRVKDSGRAKPLPGSNKKGLSWPFAALGVVEINRQDYPGSIASFQASLRIAPESYHSWVGLGESYLNTGRFIAATRAFQQAEEIDSAQKSGIEEGWFARYMLANVKRELGEFEDSINQYRLLLETKPTEFGILIAFAQTLVESGWNNIELGFFGRAVDNAIEAIDVLNGTQAVREDAFNLWKTFGDACALFTWLSTESSRIPLESIHRFLSRGEAFLTEDLLSEFDSIDHTTIASLNSGGDTDISRPYQALRAAVLGHKGAISVSVNDSHAQAVAWYNLGWIEHRAHTFTTQSRQDKSSVKYLKASMRCFKHAIELEAGNSEFWNSLGLVTTQMNPKVAQHSFVRSLFLNDKSARIWTNLGTLYLLDNDTQLANEAFTRAQSSDPDYAPAWLGQGILAQLIGDPVEAQMLFTHAYEISTPSTLICRQQYAVSTFDSLLTSSHQPQASLLSPVFSLRQLQTLDPENIPLKHLLALFLERTGAHTEASTLLESVCATLEQDYEQSESPITMALFAQAKSDLARSQLNIHDYTSALDNALTALSLFSDSSTSTKPRLSSNLTAGLALTFQNPPSPSSALPHFQAALSSLPSTSPLHPSITALFSQTLWAASSHNLAQETLLSSAELHPSHLQTTLMLGAIAHLNTDTETLAAVKDDLQSFRADHALPREQASQIRALLRVIAPSDQDRTSELCAAVMLDPGEMEAWRALADGVDEEEGGYVADMARETAGRKVPPRGGVGAEGLASALEGSGRVRDLQVARFVAPWRGRDGD